MLLATLAATFLALGATVAAAPVASAAPATITLRSQLNNKCLEVLSFNNNNGARAGLWDCWGGANQQWYPINS